MNFDCLWFCQNMQAFAENDLPSAQKRRAQNHLVHCGDCLENWSKVLEPRPDLTGAILAETDSDPCSQAELLLSQAHDGGLPAVEGALVSAHLQHCEVCRPLEAALGALSSDLGDMAFLEPDQQFTRDVLRRFGPFPSRLDWRPKFREFWMRLIRRPRFTMEAAYVLTLFLALVLQIQAPSARAVSELQSGSDSLADGLSQLTRQMDHHLGSAGERLLGNLSVYLRQTSSGPRQLLNQTALKGQTIFKGVPMAPGFGGWSFDPKPNPTDLFWGWFSRDPSRNEKNIGDTDE